MEFNKLYEDYTEQFKVSRPEEEQQDPGVVDNPKLEVGDPCYIEYHAGDKNLAGKYKIAKIAANIITCDPLFKTLGDRPDTTDTKEDGEVLDAVSNQEPQEDTLEFNRKDIVFREPHENEEIRHYIIIVQTDPLIKKFVDDRVPENSDKDENKAKEEKPKDTTPVVKDMVKPDTGIKTVAGEYLNLLKRK